MSNLFYIVAAISVIAFGGMTYKGDTPYKVLDRVWVPLFIVSYITAIILSGKLISGIVVAVVLLLGNGVFWGLVWGFPGAVRSNSRINKLVKEAEKESKKE